MRKLLAFAGAASVVLGMMYIAWPVGHIPAYDANLVRLAETDLQGYCAGESFWKSGGAGSADLAQVCRKRIAQNRPDVPNLGVVPGAFCAAIVDNGWKDGNKQDCISILSTNQLWPTYDGGLTDQWNRARPYPRVFSAAPGSPSSGSRTGSHNGSERSNNPTHNTPTYP